MSGIDTDTPSPPARRMNADEVLLVIVDRRRLARGPDAADPATYGDAPLDRTTNVQRAAHLLGLSAPEDRWIDLSRLLEQMFRVEIDFDTWKSVLLPKDKCTLGPVCDLIAEHALAPVIEIEREARSEMPGCPSAMFRTMLLVMRDAGVDVESFTPRTPLGPLVTVHRDIFTAVIPRLAPGRVPPVRSVNSSLRVSVGVLAAGLLLHIAARVMPVPYLSLLGTVVLFVGFLGLVLSGMIPTRQERLGELSTLSDLCRVLSDPPPEDGRALEAGPDGPQRWDASHHPLW